MRHILSPLCTMSVRRTSARLRIRQAHMNRDIPRSFPSSRNYMFTSSQAATQDIQNNHQLFEYTSGRWIYNERRRLAERHLVFNVDELKNAAAEALNRPTSDIKGVRKLAEGGFNRVFEITIEGASSILARLPYPSTLPRRLAVASDAATLAFAHANGVPTPRVLDYAVDENPVGAEYILMEKLPGRPIGDTWFNLSEEERLKVLLQLVTLEAKLFAIGLPANGSIYYACDLPPDTLKVDIPGSGGGLCIGPYVAEQWWFGERGELDIDRGPHNNSCRVLQAAAEKELAWIRAYGRPRFPFNREYRETFEYKRQDPKDHTRSLADYLRLAPYLVPKSPKCNLPVLRHPDLQPNNIFVSHDLTITGLIDWQHSLVLPTFLVAGVPKYFQNYDDEESMYFRPPQLADNIEILDANERARVREQYRRRHVHLFYSAFTQRLNKPHWNALEQDPGLLKRRMYHDANGPWEGLNHTLQMDLVRVSQNWSDVAAPNTDGSIPPCPIAFTEQEVQRRVALDEFLRDTDFEMRRINRLLDAASDGWVPNESFESAKERARLFKEEGLESVDDEPWLREMSARYWPFDDWDEDE